MSLLFTGISAPLTVAASGLAAAAGAYLDARFSISADLSAMQSDRLTMRRIGRRIAELDDTPTIYKMLERVVERGDGSIDALWFEDRTWSYTRLKDLADCLAAFLHTRDIKPGDTVAVFTTNSPEMVVVIYALSKLGAVAALINTSLRVFLTQKLIVSSPDLSELVRSDLPHVTLNLSSFDGVSTRAEVVTAAKLCQYSLLELAPARRLIQDLAVLVYTSGTTGKPKACAIRNMMTVITSTPLTLDANKPSKYYPLRTYSPLPLFHGTAFFTGLCYSVGSVGTLCLRRKFSASQFWKDVHDSRSTRVLYIGELCRYLLSTPPSRYYKDHACIVASGNGLRGDIWDRFRQRFGVPEIREFYRSTEGVTKFDNFGEGSWGAGKIGFSGSLRRFFESDVFIVKYDPHTEMPYRDPATGFCVVAQLGEEGEAIGRVKNRALLTEYFHNEKATEENLLHDVFQKGDLFQRSGDLVIRESSGWVKFQDRVGDTFRWKGENVSAGEIRDHICGIRGVYDAVVYGVRLDEYDGQAGAAGITLQDHSPSAERELLSNLYTELRKTGVPAFAIPRLIRITAKVNTGVTFKQARYELAKREWDPSTDLESDHLYWLNGTTYDKLDDKSWASIKRGEARL